MEKKESFIFYLSQYEAIKTLNNEQLGRLFRAIFEKQLQNNSKITEKEVVLKDDIIIAFNFINNQLLVDRKKYEDISKKRSENGKKGGAPKGNKNATKTNKTNKNKQNNLNDNENDNENVNENVNVNDNENDYNIFDYIERNFVITVNGTNLEKIQNYLQTYDDEILCYAIDVCVANGVTNLSYFFGIVDNWISSKYKTLDEIKLKDKKKNRSNNEIPLVPTSEHSWKIGG